ncbi:hypothetical protein KA005_19505 [bacterium]|nr:hypothetical protein [bacterium]
MKSSDEFTIVPTEGDFNKNSQVSPLGSYRIIENRDVESLFSLSGKMRFEPDKMPYFELCKMFVDYLTHTQTMKFEATGQVLQGDGSSAGIVKKQIPYIHRWTPVYRKSVLAKFYQLEAHLNHHPAPVTMLSLTTYQAGNYSIQQKGHAVDIEESFKIINEGWRKLRDLINKSIRKGVSYVWVLEPHTKHNTGYPHIHVILFTEFTDSEKQRITDLWSEKYKAGSAAHGVDFTFKPPEESIKSIRNYLMKYLASTFCDTGSKYGSPRWTTGILLFNALVWHHGYRMWGASRDLSKVMAWAEDEDIEEIEWFKTMLCYLDDEKIGEVWRLPDAEYQEVLKRHQDYLNDISSLKIEL